jgi:hypothetical protein
MRMGVKKCPSTCWSINVNNANKKAVAGSCNKSMNVLGIAPINGPKNGIMFVMQTNVLISNAYGISVISMNTNVAVNTIKLPKIVL